MNFACDKCQRRYTLPDEKVRGKIVKVRCKSCQFLISVGPLEDATAAVAESTAPAQRGSPWDDEPTRAAPTLDRTVSWFAMVKGAQVGPFDFMSLHRQITGNELSFRTYLWREGMADWKRAQDLPELAPLFSAVRSTGARPVIPVIKDPPPVPRVTDVAPRVTRPAVPEPEPAPRSTRPNLDLGGELFSDLDFHQAPTADAPPADEAPRKAKKKKKVEPSPEDDVALDPFSLLAPLDPEQMPIANESTSFFIAQAGVNRRNPAWKIAAFVLLVLGVVPGALYALSAMKVVHLEVTQEDDQGREVKAPVFSAQGLSGLGRTLLGNKKTGAMAKPSAAVHIKHPVAGLAERGSGNTNERSTGSVGAVASVDPGDLLRGRKGQKISPDLKALYEDTGGKKDVGPNLHKAAVVADDGPSSGGPPQEAVAKVVGQTQAAFQFCIEQKLKKNPGFRGGKVSLIATVGASGTVKKASLSKPDIEMSDLGLCLRTKAKRMAFPAFQGDDVDLDIPLILTTTL